MFFLPKYVGIYIWVINWIWIKTFADPKHENNNTISVFFDIAHPYKLYKKDKKTIAGATIVDPDPDLQGSASLW